MEPLRKCKAFGKSIEVVVADPYHFFLMAMTTNIPPQAYTRETLVKAIEWVQSQPPAVRERATSADLVVSHYLQACRRVSAAQVEAPVSGEAFKADLKHLAEDLKLFETSSPPTQPTRSPSFEFFQEPQAVAVPAVVAAPAAVTATASVSAPQTATTSASVSSPKGPQWPVDARTLAAAREVQQRLNLSSEVEALRLLVTLGAERARALFP